MITSKLCNILNGSLKKWMLTALALIILNINEQLHIILTPHTQIIPSSFH